jgi:predicted GNAT family acetyltransferase
MRPIRHERSGDGGVFLMDQDGRPVGELHYQLSAGRMLITHTEVAPALRGGGLAQELVDAAATWARQEKLKILPLCSYAGAVLKRSTAHADLLEQ